MKGLDKRLTTLEARAPSSAGQVLDALSAADVARLEEILLQWGAAGPTEDDLMALPAGDAEFVARICAKMKG